MRTQHENGPGAAHRHIPATTTRTSTDTAVARIRRQQHVEGGGGLQRLAAYVELEARAAAHHGHVQVRAEELFYVIVCVG